MDGPNEPYIPPKRTKKARLTNYRQYQVVDLVIAFIWCEIMLGYLSASISISNHVPRVSHRSGKKRDPGNEVVLFREANIFRVHSSRETVSFDCQIVHVQGQISENIFLRQMQSIVFIILHIFFKTRAEYPNDVPHFS